MMKVVHGCVLGIHEFWFPKAASGTTSSIVMTSVVPLEGNEYPDSNYPRIVAIPYPKRRSRATQDLERENTYVCLHIPAAALHVSAVHPLG